MYVQAISAYAPHPNAAKLWMEYLYSDEGQNLWLKGYCNPIRYDDMVARRRPSTRTPQAKLPDTDGHRPADARPDRRRPPTLITEGWATTVGVDGQVASTTSTDAHR